MIRSGLEMNRANRAPSSSKCNSLMHKNIHFGFNWCVASHLCSTQINSKSSKSRKFVCYEPLLKFPEHQFLCSVSVRGPRASRAPSMLGSFAGLVALDCLLLLDSSLTLDHSLSLG